MRGIFITFEGGEGSGKTTQIKLLEKHFQEKGRKCLVTREPGGSKGGDAIRQLLLTGAGDKWNPMTETLLFQAARVEHVETLIKPALARGEVVICDRFLDSTLVYQGIAKGLGVEFVNRLSELTIGSFVPDLTVLLDIDPQIGLSRAKNRAGDETRFENMDISFHNKVREGFLFLARKDPQRYAIIDAVQPEKEVHAAVLKSLVSLAVLN